MDWSKKLARSIQWLQRSCPLVSTPIKDLWSHPPIAAIQWLKNLIAPYWNTHFIPISMVKSQEYPMNIPWRSSFYQYSHEISPVSSHDIPIEQRIHIGLCRARWGFAASHRDAPGHVPSGSPRPRLSEKMWGRSLRRYGETMGNIWGTYGI